MQKLVEAGELTEEEAEHSERRNIILQALGPETTVKVDLTHQVVRRGDVLVLCSDGLSGQVGKDEIARIVSEEHDLVTVCKRLVDRANENGGPDNITVIAARFAGDGLDVVGQTDEVGHAVFPLPETGQHPALPLPIDDADRPAADSRRAPLSMAPVQQDSVGALPPDSFEPFESFTVPGSNTGAGAHAAEAPPALASAVSDERRARGMAIAIALLAVLVAGAAWYVWETARDVVPRARDTLAPASPAPPAPAGPATPGRGKAATPAPSTSASPRS
jgi:hypothetical protein